MPSSEREIQAAILRRCNRGGVRLFRNAAGKAWQGGVRSRTPEFVMLDNPRLVSFGLVEGSGDLIGWDATGRFVSVEVKSLTGRTSPAQEAWRAAVERAGGIAVVVRSVEAAEDALGLDH